jgi:ribose transport system substrate-binding protein
MSSLFKLPHRRSRKLVAAAVAALGILSFAACGSNSNANTGFEAASGSGAISGRPTPVDNPENKKVKIAVVAFAPALAEFFKAYEAGVQRANSVLGARSTTVDYIQVTTIGPDALNTAIRSAMTQKYDAIATQVMTSANCAPIKEAVAKGIVVAAINSTAKCVQSTGALFFHGEDAFSTWRDAVAKAMIKATGDKECKVGILTAGFAVESQEQRRTGFIAGLQGSKLTPVDKGVEVQVDPAKTQAATRDYVTANPDLCGIVVLFGDNGAAAAALTPEQAKKVSVVSSDLTEGSVQQIKAGKLAAAYTQDPFGQTYDTAVWLYNAVITGKGPTGGYFQPSKGQIVTGENLDAAVKAQSQGN